MLALGSRPGGGSPRPLDLRNTVWESRRTVSVTESRRRLGGAAAAGGGGPPPAGPAPASPMVRWLRDASSWWRAVSRRARSSDRSDRSRKLLPRFEREYMTAAERASLLSSQGGPAAAAGRSEPLTGLQASAAPIRPNWEAERGAMEPGGSRRGCPLRAGIKRRAAWKRVQET